jgi:hypothetical protein
MKHLGLSLLLGLVLVGLLLCASWIARPHQPAPQWHTSLHQTLTEVDGFRPSETPSR